MCMKGIHTSNTGKSSAPINIADAAIFNFQVASDNNTWGCRLKCSVGVARAWTQAFESSRLSDYISFSVWARFQIDDAYAIIDTRLLELLLTSPIRPGICLISQPPGPDAPEDSYQYT